MYLIKPTFEKVKLEYNNSLEAWNKGLIVSYTLSSGANNIITYEKGNGQYHNSR